MSELSATALVDAIADEMSRGPRPELVELARQLGAPTVDTMCTVMSARAMLIAAARGRAFYHHELRGRVPMPDALFPEVEVWDEGTVPVWQDGVFVEPKYFSFRQDAPFAAFNPVHRRKWRPHELLHGAVGFFWRADATRFETYVGSRLNELLPVVHWYGLDEVFRPRCDAHTGAVLYREFCPACEAAARPYWDVTADDHVAAVGFVRTAQEHFAREIGACRDEVASGEVRETPTGRLNASTDAVGYVLGHWNRLTAPSFHQWADLFLREGVDYFDDLERYADHVEACALRLVTGEVATTIDRFEALRSRRIVQDVAYRALLAMEWADRGDAETRDLDRTLGDVLARCAQSADALLENEHDAAEPLHALFDVLADMRAVLPDEVADPLLAFGLTFHDDARDHDWEFANLALGISEGLELTAEQLDAAHIETFAASPSLHDTGRLCTRFAHYLRERARDTDRYAAIAELATLEAWAAADPRRDEHAERFGQDLEQLDQARPGDLHINTTTRRSVCAADAVAQLTGTQFDAEQIELAGAYWRGELHLLIMDDTATQALETIARGEVPQDDDAVFALMQAAIVVYVPTVSRRTE